MTREPPNPADKSVFVAAGGTGGHVFPALALMEALAAKGRRAILATDERGARYAGDGAEVRPLPAAYGAEGAIGRLKALQALARAYAAARGLIGSENAGVVVGFGGYAAAAAGLAAPRGRLVLHEQNAVMGRTNRLLAGRARLIALGFEPTARIPEGAGEARVFGTPVREAVRALRSAYVPPDAEGPVRLVFIGGSQGAHAVARLGVEAAAALPEALRTRLDVVAQARPEDLEHVRAAYRACGVTAEVKAFFDDLPARIAQAHLVISRAGASSIAEVTALGRPAIFMPYPSAADDHQRANAAALHAAGAAAIATEDDATGESLARAIRTMVERPDALAGMADAASKWSRPEAGDALADAVLAIADGRAGA